jgi:hypothetical protein
VNKTHFLSSEASEEVIQMRKERGNYKIPIPLSNKEIRVFSLQGAYPKIYLFVFQFIIIITTPTCVHVKSIILIH